jgi:exodeoxyribonuclease VII large subunit
LAVLDRGYALVLNQNGGIVRSAAELHPGDALVTRVADGTFTSRVESTSGTA